MKTSINFAALAVAAVIGLSTTGCAVVRPGQIGLKQTLGKLKSEPINPGTKLYNPFVSRVLKINVRTVEIYETLPLPTKEGLSVQAQITLLYHVKPDMVKSVYVNYGRNYEEVFVVSNFLATAREVSSRYYAKELYAIDRELVEQVILEELSKDLNDKGFEVDAVLLKDIILPQSMSQAIQDKVNAEQATLQMEFVIEKQKKEAERMLIEAEGIKQAQVIINSSLSKELLQYNYIQMMKGLVTSPNAKVIVADGKMPVMINGE